MLDVHRLVLLREVRLRGSISAAARALSYTPSAVSQQLSLLEKEAGVPLLEKVGRGVRLTPGAEELVHHAEQILSILERAEADLAASDTQVRGTLNLAAFTTISRNTVPRVIAALGRQHPALDVRFRQVEPEEGLLLLSSRRVDVLVVDSYPGTSAPVQDEIHVDLLLNDPIRAYLPTGADDGTLEGLRRLRWVLEPSGSEAHAWVLGVCRQHGFEPNVAYESADLMFHLRMVEAGLAAAFLPDLLVRGEKASMEPSALLDTRQRRQISLICRAGAERRPAVVACRDAFAEHL
ncbi:LysR family transcriptional regulator [Nocardioides eburneiflavus]|uniref:LysR family transcriptional regulator n=1 Tax=Nocardioides eburneiflavus TaxID=2518372 RepID=A0A4Z1CGS2_9ACTN|nr:LysR substrate-binding domain-containing protein [Nocardioides eburneiflavus]TGN65158.1 LysR family transcriptional regulator [Nocardioides eburneiflavus]